MQKTNVWLATALLNNPVRNSAGENLGKIEDVVIDPETGTIRYAVLSFGGVLGMGDKLFAIPWPLLSISPLRDYVLLNIDKPRLERAPGFDRHHWPDMADPSWQRGIDDYYTVATPPVRERTLYVQPRPERRRISVLAGILLVGVLFGLLWVTYLVSTRGWEQAKQDIRSSVQGAAYAAKETSQNAALSTKVKTALSLSKRIPAGSINVDSDIDVVTLRGDVKSVEIRDLAEQITRDVPGVREVHNHLYVLSQGR